MKVAALGRDTCRVWPFLRQKWLCRCLIRKEELAAILKRKEILAALKDRDDPASLIKLRRLEIKCEGISEDEVIL